MNTNLDIGIGVVNWKSPVTLKNSLESWARNGLFHICANTVVWAQEPDKAVRDVLEKFKRDVPNFNYLLCKHNIGIGRTWAQLFNNLQNKQILILEDDWELVEDYSNSFTLLQSASELLERDNYKCIRLRHRQRYGDPLFSLHLKDHETEPNNLYWLADCIHWREQPEWDFSQYINMILYKGINWYKFNNQYANFTANPCLYNRNWLMENIYETVKHSQGYKSIEIEVNPVWKALDFNVLAGDGLFMHNRLIE